MNANLKHWIDIATGIAAAVATVATPIITCITGVLGIIWYSIRIYDWWKGRKDANLRHD